MKILISVLMAVAVVGQINAQDIQALMYKAYLTNSMTLWEKAVSVTQKKSDKQPENQELKFDLALAQYGFMSATMADKNEDQFNKYLDTNIKNLEELIERDDNWAEVKAILSSVYGLQMGYSPWKGMYLGSKSGSLIEVALRKKPESPMVNKLYAGSKLFTPEMFGGDVNESIKHYEIAIKLYELDSIKTKSNWLYLDTMAFLGMAYMKAEQSENAVAIYQKAIKVEPEFGWVKNVLLPEASN